MVQACSIILVISVASNIVLPPSIIITLILTRPKPQGGEQLNVTSKYNSSGVCLSCDSLGSSVRAEETLYDKIITTGCGRKICCLNNRGNLVELIEKIANGPIMYNNATQITGDLIWWRERENAAHLALGKIQKKKGPLSWHITDDIGLAFIKGLRMKDSTKIKVEKEGTYFVYTAVSYNFTGQDTIKPFYHQLLKSHPFLPAQGKQTIVMSKYGGNEIPKTNNSSFLCATVKLLSGEEIETYFSRTSYIDNRKHKNYLGIFHLW